MDCPSTFQRFDVIDCPERVPGIASLAGVPGAGRSGPVTISVMTLPLVVGAGRDPGGKRGSTAGYSIR